MVKAAPLITPSADGDENQFMFMFGAAGAAPGGQAAAGGGLGAVVAQRWLQYGGMFASMHHSDLLGNSPCSSNMLGGQLQHSAQSVRSEKGYTGVYKCRNGWKTQFCLGSTVVNLGVFTTEDDAARCWNEAALLLRGAEAKLNAVTPALPGHHQDGKLLLASSKAADAIKLAAVKAGLPTPDVEVLVAAAAGVEEQQQQS